jgi:hypothetical protein
MEKSDLYGLYFWGFSSLLVIIGGILNITEERNKDNPDYSTGIMVFLVGFTPGSMLIVSFLLIVCVMYAVVECPNRLLKKILNKKHAS